MEITGKKKFIFFLQKTKKKKSNNVGTIYSKKKCVFFANFLSKKLQFYIYS